MDGLGSVLSSQTHYVNKQGQDSSSSTSFINRISERFNIRFDKNDSFRKKKLKLLKLILESEIYDNLKPFYIEYSGQMYVPLAQRRPSVTYPLAKIIVDESTSLLFGEEHFPVVRCDKECQKTTEFLQYINKECHIKEVMLLAAKTGALGSVAILLKLLNGKFYFEVLETKNLAPVFDNEVPDRLSKLTQKIKTDGSTLQSYGHDIDKEKLNDFYYCVTEWDKNQETVYKPYPCDKEDDLGFKPTIDEVVIHDFGFVPIVWIKNLPSNNIDGACTFFPAIDFSIEIDYQLSQNGRLLKYNSDPTLVIKNPTNLGEDKIMKSLSIISLDEKGDAFYAEMSGKSCEAVISYVKMLREYALEGVRGNRVSPEKISASQSGIGFQMMNMALIGLVQEMRLTYGEYGLMTLYAMIIDIANSDRYELDYDEYAPDKNHNCKAKISLDWPDWYPDTPQEELQESQALTNYVEKGVLSKKTAVASIADEFNIFDIDEEMENIATEKKIDYDNKVKADGVARPAKKGLNGVQSKYREDKR